MDMSVEIRLDSLLGIVIVYRSDMVAHLSFALGVVMLEHSSFGLGLVMLVHLDFAFVFAH